MTRDGAAELASFEDVFAALANESRRTILAILSARGGELTSGAIAARFDCSWPTTTRHLRTLEQARLVHVELRGRERIYRLDRERLTTVVDTWLRSFRA